jgi:hypothetical protein
VRNGRPGDAVQPLFDSMAQTPVRDACTYGLNACLRP